MRLKDLAQPFRDRRRRDFGLAPGTLVFSGEKKVDQTVISVIDYRSDHLEERILESVDEIVSYKDSESTSWINIDGLHDVDVIRQVGELLSVHRLVLEDIVHTDQRPKIEIHDGYLFIVVRMVKLLDSGTMDAEQISLLVGPSWVISFQEETGDVLEPLRLRIRQLTGRIRYRGPDYLAYAILDVIVDHYFVLLENLSVQIDELETYALESPGPAAQRQLASLRRQLIVLRKACWPMRELISSFERSESELVQPDTVPFLRDAYDHVIQTIDIVESLRDMLGIIRDSYQAALGNRMNEIMKVLTIIATIFIPLTFIAGIYGMNFEHMPELGARWGYPVALGFMLLLGVGLWLFFKWKKWV